VIAPGRALKIAVPRPIVAVLLRRIGAAGHPFHGVAAAYGRAHDAVAAEESLERKYRLEPDADVREQHRHAGDDLTAARSAAG
jgi:hypothetical protein